MQIHPIIDGFAVSPQITRDDVETLRNEGFATIICNRPDGEEPGQPPVEDIAQAAHAAGLEFHFLPLSGTAVTPELVASMRTAIGGASGPVLAYCRSGTRCAALWALSEAGARPRDEILQLTAAAGYDLSGLSGMLPA